MSHNSLLTSSSLADGSGSVTLQSLKKKKIQINYENLLTNKFVLVSHSVPNNSLSYQHDSPVVQTAFVGAFIIQCAVQSGLSSLYGRFDGDSSEIVIQPRGSRENGLIDVSAQFGMNHPGVDRVHRHSST